jgi:hypothetical protein
LGGQVEKERIQGRLKNRPQLSNPLATIYARRPISARAVA